MHSVLSSIIIQFALDWYLVPSWFADFVFQYYESLCAVVTTKDWTTNPFSYGIGVFQGCVVSPTLFLIVYQIVLDYIEEFGSQPYMFRVVDEGAKHLNNEIHILQMRMLMITH